MTPFKALYGCDSPTLVNYIVGTACNAQVDRELQEIDELLRALKKKFLAKSNRSKEERVRT